MQEDNNNFGMTEQEMSSYKRQAFFSKIKLFFEKIEPAVVKILSLALYYLMRFLKALVSTIIKMITGKEI